MLFCVDPTLPLELGFLSKFGADLRDDLGLMLLMYLRVDLGLHAQVVLVKLFIC